MSGCAPTEQEKFRELQQQLNTMAIERIDLESRLAKRDATIQSLQQQLANLRARGQAPPVPLFEIDRVEILDISGGTDLDGKLGDDAVTVYFRPVDGDGDVLKRGGEITIKLLDHTPAGQTRQVGYVHITDSDEIRRCWYGKFWTRHYKIVVPIARGADLKPGQEIDIYLVFVDFATGRPYPGRKVIRMNLVNADEDIEP